MAAGPAETTPSPLSFLLTFLGTCFVLGAVLAVEDASSYGPLRWILLPIFPLVEELSCPESELINGRVGI